MQYDPFQAPLSVEDLDRMQAESVRKVISAQKQLILAIFAVLVPVAAVSIIRPDMENVMAATLTIAFIGAGYLFGFYSVFRLARALDSAPWIYMAVMLVPYINIIMLIKLNQEASEYLKNNGCEIGLFGARKP